VLEPLEQAKTSKSQEESQQKPKGKGKGKPGRRKGSKNSKSQDLENSPYLQFVQKQMKENIALIC
jgi:hypothetical protein